MLMCLMPKTCCRRKSGNPVVPLTISNSNNVVEALPRSSMRLPQQHVSDGHDTPDNGVVGSRVEGEERRSEERREKIAEGEKCSVLPSPRIDATMGF